MSRDSHDSTYGSWSKLKASLNISTSEEHAEPTSQSRKMLKKHRKRPSILPDGTDDTAIETPKSRPSLSLRSSIKRPAALSSLRSSTRSNAEQEYGQAEPLSAASTHAPSFSFGDGLSDVNTRNVIMHGEVQTSAGMFRKKKEYLVLTDNAITRYKNQSKAAEAYSIIPQGSGRPSIKHGQMPSYGSSSDLQTVSDSSGDRSGRIQLEQVVAVHTHDDSKPYFIIEVSYLEDETGHAAVVTMQFANPSERDTWLRCIRVAVAETLSRHGQQISGYNVEYAARLVERENDYDPNNCIIYKVVRRSPATKPSARSSSDDISKVASTVVLLAIGVHKIHLISLARPVSRTSSPSLALPAPGSHSFGILNIVHIKFGDLDDTFDLTIHQPFHKPQKLFLASASAFDIISRLYYSENVLRPETDHRLLHVSAPATVIDALPSSVESTTEEHCWFQNTLIAYCVAYGVDSTNIRYAIDYECEDAPRFNLLRAADERQSQYHPLELLAIMRALRYNETFTSYSFAGISLDGLREVYDPHGQDYVCTRTKMNTMIKMPFQELSQSCLLKQEVRALAVTNRKLRRIDFSNCISTKPKTPMRLLDESQESAQDLGCAIVEALMPLCRQQITNVDWICLNGIDLSDLDLDYVIGAAVDKACHLRALELNRCGLTDRTLGLILDSLRAQENTLEALELAGNAARINPATFDSQLSVFSLIRRLNLSYISRTSGPEPLLQADTYMIWRLSELRISGTSLNAASIEALAAYLQDARSQSLHELYLDNTALSGADIAQLLEAMAHEQVTPRQLHLDISANNVCKDLEQLTHAVSASLTPTHLTMRAIEYREESQFRKMLAALTINKSTISLNMSQTALPGDASADTCRALSKLLSTNDTLIELNISGDDSRLASSMFGSGINEALIGLGANKTLRTLHVEQQRLGLLGANTLAEALRQNRTLQELFCGSNEIPLSGLTDLVNALIDNTTLIYLPSMDDGREAALKAAEVTMRGMKLEVPPARVSPSPKSLTSTSYSPLRKGLTGARKTIQRTTAAHAPAFPALQSYANSVANPIPTSPPPQIQLNLPRSRQVSDSASAIPVSFTMQDIQTTHRLLSEQWDRQCYRLAKYLERNWCLLNNIPVPLQIEDEKFERPESAGSLAKMLEQVKFDTTPRAERDLYFDGPGGEAAETTSRQFLVGSGSVTPNQLD